MVTITTGTGCTAGNLATVAFGTAYGVAPNIVLTPANQNAATAQYYTNSPTTAQFVVASNNAPTATSVYKYYYRSLE